MCSIYSVFVGPELINVDGSVGPLKLQSKIVDVQTVSSLSVGDTPVSETAGIPLDGTANPDDIRRVLGLHGITAPATGEMLIRGGEAPIVQSAPSEPAASASVTTSAATNVPTAPVTAQALTITSGLTTGVSPAVVTQSERLLESDALAGDAQSRYVIVETSVVDGQRTARLEARDAQDRLLAQLNLPTMADVLWRSAEGEAVAIAGSRRLVSCSDRLWVVQDGYQLRLVGSDRGLLNSREHNFAVRSDAETVLVTSTSCVGEQLAVAGYVLPVSARAPALSGATDRAGEFVMRIGPAGDLLSRELREVEFSVPSMCAGARDEALGRFCRAAEAGLS